MTFTNKAAKEMLTRAEDLVQRRFNSGYSGTFHSFANRLLRSHADVLGFSRDFTILDADDAKKLVRACADELGISMRSMQRRLKTIGLTFSILVDEVRFDLAREKLLHSNDTID